MSFAAILSASRASGDSSGGQTTAGQRASLYFAGQTLVEYQARQAAQAGADRIMILVSVITPALSQAVDRLSADGIAVALVRDMVSMVRDAPRDADVLLVADGAIVSQTHFEAMASAEGNALLVTDDSRASTPFERIDAGQRWAGLARISPTLLFGTLDMIGDWDLSLTLVRAAVQKGARRVTVAQDDLLEGRVALIETQQQADLVAQAVTAAGASSARARGGVEHYLLSPLARMISPALMRMQVPAMQVRIAAIALAAIALVPVELLWTLTGTHGLAGICHAITGADRHRVGGQQHDGRRSGAAACDHIGGGSLAAYWRRPAMDDRYARHRAAHADARRIGGHAGAGYQGGNAGADRVGWRDHLAPARLIYFDSRV